MKRKTVQTKYDIPVRRAFRWDSNQQGKPQQPAAAAAKAPLLVLPVVSAGAAQPAAADPTPVQTQTETAEAAQHQYSYIALGDSIVAGIGLPDAVYQRNGRYYDVSGNYQGYSKDCYVARVAEGLGLSRDQTANYGMPALMSGDLLELVRTGSCQSASINFSLPDLRQELKHAQVITVEIGEGRRQVQEYGVASFDGDTVIPMVTGDRIVIEKAAVSTKILKLNHLSFVEVLRQKMRDS